MLLRFCRSLYWWGKERRLPWCDECKMRHTPQPLDPSRDGGSSKPSAFTNTKPRGITTASTGSDIPPLTPAGFNSRWVRGIERPADTPDLLATSHTRRSSSSYGERSIYGIATSADSVTGADHGESGPRRAELADLPENVAALRRAVPT